MTIIITVPGKQPMTLTPDEARQLVANLKDAIIANEKQNVADGGWQVFRLLGDEDGDVTLLCNACADADNEQTVAWINSYRPGGGDGLSNDQVAELLRIGQRHLGTHHSDLITTHLVYLPERGQWGPNQDREGGR